MNNLTCPICTNKLHTPKLCPHCSQVFCKQCIVTYLKQKHFCPSCDNYIIDLIDCGRLVDQFQQVVIQRKYGPNVGKYQENQRGSKGNIGGSGFCSLHQLEYIYYCKQCQIWICADCGVLQQKHHGHEILTKKEGNILEKDKLKSEIQKLTQKIFKINKKKQKTVLDLEVYRAELKWAKSRIQKYYQDLVYRIDAEGQKQIQELLQRIKQYQIMQQSVKKRKIQLESMFNRNTVQFRKVSNNNNSNNVNNKFSSERKLVSPLSHNNNLNSFPNLPPSPSLNPPLNQNILYQHQYQQHQQQQYFNQQVRKIQIIEQIFPNFATFTYEFDYQNYKFDHFHYSQYFQLWGQDWRLKIYPNGNNNNSNNNNDGRHIKSNYSNINNNVDGKYLSVFLQLASCHRQQKPKKYVYRVQLLSLNRAGSTIVKQYTSIFDTGESWGYSDYLNLNHLHQYLHDGKLLFNIGIRNQNYEGLCCDLKKYIGKILNQNRILEKLLCQSSVSLQLSNNNNNTNNKDNMSRSRSRSKISSISNSNSKIQSYVNLEQYSNFYARQQNNDNSSSIVHIDQHQISDIDLSVISS